MVLGQFILETGDGKTGIAQDREKSYINQQSS